MSNEKHPAPWRLELSGGPTATVYDAKGELVMPIGEMECGWTDTTTGNYVDPDPEIEVISRVIAAVNNYRQLLDCLEYTCNLLDRLPRYSDLDLPDNPGETASVVRSARAAIAKAHGQ